MSITHEKHRGPTSDIAITVSREVDRDYQWDGDGLDPRESGMEPYTVVVTAYHIENGMLQTGESILSGCYYMPEDTIGDVDGYLPQLIDDAVDNLRAAYRGSFDKKEQSI